MTDAPKTNDQFSRFTDALPVGIDEVLPPERPKRNRPPGGLTVREARFVAAYIGGQTPLQAMAHANYERPDRSEAALILQRPGVRAAVAAQVEAAAMSSQVTASRIIAEHAAIAFSDITDVTEALRDNSSTTHEALASLPRSVTAAIRKVKVTRRYEGKGDDAMPVDTVEFELHDKQKSLDALAKVSDLYRSPEVEDAITGFGEMLRAAVRSRGIDDGSGSS